MECQRRGQANRSCCSPRVIQLEEGGEVACPRMEGSRSSLTRPIASAQVLEGHVRWSLDLPPVPVPIAMAALFDHLERMVGYLIGGSAGESWHRGGSLPSIAVRPSFSARDLLRLTAAARVWDAVSQLLPRAAIAF